MNELLIYHQNTGKIESMELEDNQSMPYMEAGKLTVGDFKIGSTSPILWTTREVLTKIDQTFTSAFKPLSGFCRVYEMPHTYYRHYTGEAIDIFNTPVSAHMPAWDRMLLLTDRLHLQMGISQPFSPITKGSRGVTVMVLQDMLNLLGYTPDNIDGIFGDRTMAALKTYQRKSKLKANGVCDFNSWQFLFQDTMCNASLVV